MEICPQNSVHMTHYTHMGPYSNLVDAVARQGELWPMAAPGAQTQQRVREVLGFCSGEEQAIDLRVDATWHADGVQGEALSWSVGYGPRTQAWLLKPEGTTGPLPGVLALHDHGGFKYFGKEKIAQGPAPVPTILRDYQAHYYGGRAYANALARAGHAVLVHDTFLWGSRRWPLADMPVSVRDIATGYPKAATADAIAHTASAYNAAAAQHEHVAAKYCNILGTSMAGVVCHEDRIAFNVLRALPGVDAAACSSIGLSGGGNRAAMLNATHDEVAATVIVGLMTTYEGVLDHNVWTHTWMLYPHGLSRHMDWPDLAACRAPKPLLVQYDADDDLFTPAGMHAADARIAALYRGAGAADRYRGVFYPGPHRFTLDMQADAFAWLGNVL